MNGDYGTCGAHVDVHTFSDECLGWRDAPDPGDTTALDAIAAVMSGTEWDADTTEAVAGIVMATGREILQPDEVDEAPLGVAGVQP